VHERKSVICKPVWNSSPCTSSKTSSFDGSAPHNQIALSWMECLDGDNEAFPSHKAASFVLEEFADSTKQAALNSALVYHYIQARSVWKGHPDADVAFANSFLKTLHDPKYVKGNIAIGSSADLSKQKNLKVIEQA
jgi:hypothetical protein